MNDEVVLTPQQTLEVLYGKTIRPGVVIDGTTYYPPNCLYVIALAINGVKWAEDLCNDLTWADQARMVLNKEGFINGDGI